MDPRLTRLVVITVTGMWVVALLADVFLPEYEIPPTVHVAMMAVVGAATGRYILRDRNRDGDL